MKLLFKISFETFEPIDKPAPARVQTHRRHLERPRHRFVEDAEQTETSGKTWTFRNVLKHEQRKFRGSEEKEEKKRIFCFFFSRLKPTVCVAVDQRLLMNWCATNKPPSCKVNRAASPSGWGFSAAPYSGLDHFHVYTVQRGEKQSHETKNSRETDRFPFNTLHCLAFDHRISHIY